jgi:hypothetical protein
MTSGEVGVITGSTGDASREITVSTISHTTSTPENVVPYTVVSDNVAEAFAGAGVGGSPYVPSIAFSTPLPGSTAPDFRKWELSASNMPVDGTLYRFDVVYTQFGGSETYDDFNLGDSYYSPEILSIPKSLAFSIGSEWSAQGFLYSTSTTDDNLAVMDPGDAIASTSLVFFNIGAISTSTPSSTPPLVSVCPSAPPIFELTSALPC